MCDFIEQSQVDEIGDAAPSLAHQTITYLTERLVMTAVYEGDRLVCVWGSTMKVEQIEMNMVKITPPWGETYFRELGDDVKWLNEDEEGLPLKVQHTR